MVCLNKYNKNFPLQTNCAILQRDFDLAISNLTILLDLVASDKRPKLFSAIGRIHLQLGNFKFVTKLASFPAFSLHMIG